METFFFDYINMLKSRYLASCSNDVVDIYAQLEHDIIIDMVKRLAKMGKVTDSSEWQAKILKEIGSLQTNISGYLSKYNSQAQKTIQQLFSDSMNKAISEDVKMFNIAQRELSESEKQVLQSTFSKIEDTKKINKTYARMETNHSSDEVFQKLKRLTMTVAATSENQFIQSANNAFMQVSSGAIDYDSAFKSAVQELARKGINTVEYTDSGKRIIRTIESAVRSNIMTGINQNASEITLSNCEDLGTDLVEVSAHLGAREEHAEWQGKVYCLSGERDYLDSEGNTQHAQNFYEVCKFGEPTGICGINCRHSYYPYFEGTEKQYSDKELDEYKDNKVSYEDSEGNKHEITQYEAEQMLRGYERNIRKYKTEADAFFESGFGDSPEALKAKSKIREWQGKAKDLCKQTGIRRDYAREYIGTVSGKQPTGIKGNIQNVSSTITNNFDVYQKGTKEYTNIYNSLVDNPKSKTSVSCEKLKITENDVLPFKNRLNENDIIKRISGGDETSGSCSSVANAYIANKAGFDVLDFRGGQSLDIFSKKSSSIEMANFNGVISHITQNTNDFISFNELIPFIEEGKQYKLGIGRHAAIVRKNNNVLEYLELQHPDEKFNKFTPFTNNTLKDRFDCKRSRTHRGIRLINQAYLIEIESLGRSREFIELMKYLNTSISAQKKGIGGTRK